MNNKQKRRVVNLYQLGVYVPGGRRRRQVEPLVWELTGVDYPYRKGNTLDLSLFDAFLPDETQDRKR